MSRPSLSLRSGAGEHRTDEPDARPRRHRPWRPAAHSPLQPAVVTATWLGAVALVAAALVATVGLQRTAARRAAAWGSSATVWVAARPLPAGTVLAPGDAAPRRYPLALLPDAALRADGAEAATITGRRLQVPLVAGDVLVADRFGTAPGPGAGQVAVALAAAAVPRPGGLRLAPGTPLVLLLAATADPEGAAVAHGTAVAATVLDDPGTDGAGGVQGTTELVVAVAAPEAAAVADAVRRADVVVGLLSTPPPPTG